MAAFSNVSPDLISSGINSVAVVPAAAVVYANEFSQDYVHVVPTFTQNIITYTSQMSTYFLIELYGKSSGYPAPPSANTRIPRQP